LVPGPFFSSILLEMAPFILFVLILATKLEDEPERAFAPTNNSGEA
jgi:hypothetical protein